ncbi:MAG: DUF1963 domain-containing protein [Lachnospiraceae bacterium]|nr:DUF1963 domain-containing protein [Lachnospiraceae bacterium]
MGLNSLKDVYTEIRKNPIGYKVIFNEIDAAIELYKDNIAVKTSYDFQGIKHNIQLNSMEYIYNMNNPFNYEDVYDFLMGILKGDITFVPNDNLYIQVNGWSTVRPKKESVVKRVITGTVGVVLIAFGLLMTAVVIDMSSERDSQAAKELLSTLCVYAASFIAGVGLLKRGILGSRDNKKLPLFLGGVTFLFFGLTLLIMNWAMHDNTKAMSDEIGASVVFLIFMAFGILFIVLSYRKPYIPKIMLKRVPKLPCEHELKEIIDSVHEQIKRDIYRINVDLYRRPDIFGSKIGGDFYWDMSKPYPKDYKGYNMLFVAQLNLEEFPSMSRFPNYGILQIFVVDETEYGTDEYDEYNAAVAAGMPVHKIVYHNFIDRTFTKDKLRTLGVKSNDEYYSSLVSIYGELALSVSRGTAYSNSPDNNQIMFDTAARMGITLDDTLSFFELSNAYSSLYGNDINDEGNTNGSITIGCIGDTPEYKNVVYNYDILLFEIKSFSEIDYLDYSSEDDADRCIVWNEESTAQFYINSRNLGEMNFNDVYFSLG